jgi:DNA-binding beta-propeller fold protein YncE
MLERKRTGRRSIGAPPRLFLLCVLAIIWFYGSVPRRTSAYSAQPEGLPADEIFASFSGTCAMPPDTQAPPSGSISSRPQADDSSDFLPIRSIVDQYPSFNGIAFDPDQNVIVLSDTNKKSLLAYRRPVGKDSEEETAPLHQIIGPATNLGFVAGVAIDPKNREIYAVNNDIEDRMVVFSSDDEGSVKPRRILHVPYSSWGVAVNARRDEVAVSVQQINGVVIYRREAKGLEAPVRSIMGLNTGMADPHGILWDEKNDELFVSDHGNANKEGTTLSSTDYRNPEARIHLSLGGAFRDPAIHVYGGGEKGDVKPSRTIQGSLTGLNWPTGMAIDRARNEVAVANSGDNSVLIFRRTQSGNVSPLRTIKGYRTGINRPMGVAIDQKDNELWVANFGDHTALVFDLSAGGNASPKRIVRNAPKGTPTVGFGNPMALAYDSKREEIVVGN